MYINELSGNCGGVEVAGIYKPNPSKGKGNDLWPDFLEALGGRAPNTVYFSTYAYGAYKAYSDSIVNALLEAGEAIVASEPYPNGSDSGGSQKLQSFVWTTSLAARKCLRAGKWTIKKASKPSKLKRAVVKAKAAVKKVLRKKKAVKRQIRPHWSGND